MNELLNDGNSIRITDTSVTIANICPFGTSRNIVRIESRQDAPKIASMLQDWAKR